MFFVMGINSGRKDLNFFQSMICRSCGEQSDISVFMTYTVLSLFFIPCFKWGKRYFVTFGCCGTVYEITKDAGKAIERGENIRLLDEDFLSMCGREQRTKTCRSCGYQTTEDFEYCPKCGVRF